MPFLFEIDLGIATLLPGTLLRRRLIIGSRHAAAYPWGRSSLNAEPRQDPAVENEIEHDKRYDNQSFVGHKFPHLQQMQKQRSLLQHSRLFYSQVVAAWRGPNPYMEQTHLTLNLPKSDLLFRQGCGVSEDHGPEPGQRVATLGYIVSEALEAMIHVIPGLEGDIRALEFCAIRKGLDAVE